MNEQSISFFGKSKNFIRDSKDELKRISVPTRAESMQATVVTMLIVALLAVFLVVMDLILKNVMELLIP